MTDHSGMKLGKAPKKHDARTLKMAAYVDFAALPPLPEVSDWGDKVPVWGMMLNDKYGDCTCAGVGHGILLDTTVNGDAYVAQDNDVLALYEAITGQEGDAFDPSTGANDNGCAELDVLNYWRQTGLAGHRIGAYASIDPGRQDHLKAAIAFFGSAYVGVQLPLSAQGQEVWDVVDGNLTGNAAPGTWGGHCVILVGYDPSGLTCVTWGALKKLTWAWWKAYSDEAYVTLSNDWVTGIKPAPSGFDLDQLQADLAEL